MIYGKKLLKSYNTIVNAILSLVLARASLSHGFNLSGCCSSLSPLRFSVKVDVTFENMIFLSKDQDDLLDYSRIARCCLQDSHSPPDFLAVLHHVLACENLFIGLDYPFYLDLTPGGMLPLDII